MASKGLIEHLAEAGADDLEEVRRQIASLQREIDSLRVLERFLDVKVNGPKRRANPSPKPAPRESDAKAKGRPPSEATLRREKIAEYLVHAGPTRPAFLCEEFDIPSGSITGILDHPWFERTPNGVTLTPEGRKAAG